MGFWLLVFGFSGFSVVLLFSFLCGRHEAWRPLLPEMKRTQFEQAMAPQLRCRAQQVPPIGHRSWPEGRVAVQEAVEVFIYIVLFYRRHAYSIDVVFSG